MPSGFVLLAFIAAIDPKPWVLTPQDQFLTMESCQEVRGQMAKLFGKNKYGWFWCVPAATPQQQDKP